MADKKQQMRYSDKELEIIKGTFAENEDLLKAIRKSLWQFPLDVGEQAIVQLNVRDDVARILRKTLLPTLEGDAPFHQVIDLWMTVKIETLTPEEALPHLIARQKIIDYLSQQLRVLEGEKITKKIKFDSLSEIEGKTPLEAYSDLVARNTLIAHIEMQLMGLFMLAGVKDETVEQTKERLAKDSSK